MPIKYIPATKREIRNYRQERAIKERNRKEITEASYITLRRLHLQFRKNNPSFETTANKFNTYIKGIKHNQTMDVFHYFVSNIF